MLWTFPCVSSVPSAFAADLKVNLDSESTHQRKKWLRVWWLSSLILTKNQEHNINTKRSQLWTKKQPINYITLVHNKSYESWHLLPKRVTFQNLPVLWPVRTCWEHAASMGPEGWESLVTEQSYQMPWTCVFECVWLHVWAFRNSLNVSRGLPSLSVHTWESKQCISAVWRIIRSANQCVA